MYRNPERAKTRHVTVSARRNETSAAFCSTQGYIRFMLVYVKGHVAAVTAWIRSCGLLLPHN